MNNLFNRPATPDAAAIRQRIFNVLPAASYQMEKLFGLFDIEFSTKTETAAVECRTTPRLLLNKGFLDKYCRDDGDLFQLILHEHQIKGHDLSKASLKNTWGTDINAVLEHLTGIPAGRRPKAILIATDGYVGLGRTDLIARLDRTRIVVALTDSGHPADLQRWAHEMIQLPKLTKP